MKGCWNYDCSEPAHRFVREFGLHSRINDYHDISLGRQHLVLQLRTSLHLCIHAVYQTHDLRPMTRDSKLGLLAKSRTHSKAVLSDNGAFVN